MAELSTYIALPPGQTAEAFAHWADVFGGEAQIMTYGDTPMEGMPFEPDPDWVAHAHLALPGGAITGGDAMPGEEYNIRGSAYSLLYHTDSPDEARTLIDKLVAGGGEQTMPFELAPWGGYYGQVFDKFGVMWAFDADGPAA